MSAFDSIFDPAAFDSAPALPPGPVLIGTGSLAAVLALSVGDPYVFQTSLGTLRWSARLMIGTVDFSDRLKGEMTISGGEDTARLASFSLLVTSSAELLSLDQKPVTIDFTLQSGGVTTTVRRFTGTVEAVEFNAAARVATLDCRDGYQEIPRACTSASSVISLFGGLAAGSLPLLGLAGCGGASEDAGTSGSSSGSRPGR